MDLAYKLNREAGHLAYECIDDLARMLAEIHSGDFAAAALFWAEFCTGAVCAIALLDATYEAENA